MKKKLIKYPKNFNNTCDLINNTKLKRSARNPGLPLKEYSLLWYEEENKNSKKFVCKIFKIWINTDEK